jgi:hypothetical protein
LRKQGRKNFDDIPEAEPSKLIIPPYSYWAM